MTELYHVVFYVLPFISGMAIGISIGLKAKSSMLDQAIKELSEHQGKTTQEIWENLRKGVKK